MTRTAVARHLAIVLSSDGDLPAVLRLARAARGAAVEVGLFVMDAAVAALATAPDALVALVEDDCEVVVCATSASAHGLTDAAFAGAVLGSQDDHARLVHRADRVLAFT